MNRIDYNKYTATTAGIVDDEIDNDNKSGGDGRAGNIVYSMCLCVFIHSFHCKKKTEEEEGGGRKEEQNVKAIRSADLIFVSFYYYFIVLMCVRIIYINEIHIT